MSLFKLFLNTPLFSGVQGGEAPLRMTHFDKKSEFPLVFFKLLLIFFIFNVRITIGKQQITLIYE